MNPYTQAIILSASTLRMEKYSNGERGVRAFIKVATRQRVFRNLFYYRLGEYVSVFIQWLLPPERSLHIWCPSIGEGCHFEHNYSTYLNAERIGRNFYCLQLVTLGNDTQGCRPIIGNDVSIYTGATVFGGITIGNDVVIGAGAVVRRDVPDHCTVVGNPAYIVRQNGQKTHIKL